MVNEVAEQSSDDEYRPRDGEESSDDEYRPIDDEESNDDEYQSKDEIAEINRSGFPRGEGARFVGLKEITMMMHLRCMSSHT
ncbi:hypothetical protein V3C99_002132 [Haemonchus contortus]